MVYTLFIYVLTCVWLSGWIVALHKLWWHTTIAPSCQSLSDGVCWDACPFCRQEIGVSTSRTNSTTCSMSVFHECLDILLRDVNKWCEASSHFWFWVGLVQKRLLFLHLNVGVYPEEYQTFPDVYSHVYQVVSISCISICISRCISRCIFQYLSGSVYPGVYLDVHPDVYSRVYQVMSTQVCIQMYTQMYIRCISICVYWVVYIQMYIHMYIAHGLVYMDMYLYMCVYPYIHICIYT